MAKKLLILEDGTVFEGLSFGSSLDVTGELVFCTGNTGYQEIITNPSHNGKILVFTSPLIGNYGIHRSYSEAIIPTCLGVVVAEYSRCVSSDTSKMNLDEFLKMKKVPAMSGVDTRYLMQVIKEKGFVKATLAEAGDVLSHLQDQLIATVLPTNNVEQVSTKTAYPSPASGRNIVVLDFGLKHSILRELSKRQCDVTVIPYNTSLEGIKNLYPEGIILSNGPGNPEKLQEVLNTIKELQKSVPVLGIGLGHQLIAMANGAEIMRLPVAKKGPNYPMRDIATGRLETVSQFNHFTVNRLNLPHDLLVTHEGLNDQEIVALRHRSFPVMSVQFYPEAAPGPHDVTYFFDEFLEMIGSRA
ncbi:carbamoyl phosphate synthase small subunit [Streptococcus agalactiae]|uniref:carbamoyl phosphate synthase small subunit n=1 Tax=Streptococcus agalactiae TaxID=1311 RepID=UPI0002D715A9|nr:carbamoyl phosphate synthase small subunit [Streptococcus agalactiae]EPX05359.1 carbamoyl phosphate synthase small subunit [Streptococcus agalactiae MRI Z1-215]OCL38374.1 carbamoyl phosphate synthase small subunit [Streptococcus agalactiae]CFQ98346.1 carbamoyl phosphate synthase small subunit [Streptococcus agalactiae]